MQRLVDTQAAPRHRTSALPSLKRVRTSVLIALLGLVGLGAAACSHNEEPARGAESEPHAGDGPATGEASREEPEVAEDAEELAEEAADGAEELAEELEEGVEKGVEEAEEALEDADEPIAEE